MAYAILHLVPELHDYTLELAELEGPDSLRTEHLIYMVTLLGLVMFYGLEKSALRSRKNSEKHAFARRTSSMFWLHIASYAAYNGLIGYVLTQENRSILSLLSFLVGIGLHFVVNDHSLHAHHQELYRRYGRWCLSVAVLAGCTYGLLTNIHPILTAVSTAFLSGGILLNSFKEELPAERESHFGAFVTGTLVYAAITLVS